MSQRGLEALLRPKSIAVIGASMKPNRAGYLMMRNLLAGGFNGPVLPVTPAWKAVLGVLAWPDIASLPFTPDLAVLCTNASRNPALPGPADRPPAPDRTIAPGAAFPRLHPHAAGA